ncbi:unnamed protein product [Closterium sp. Yama58-4]|nr:unnamed protein product [Closterium sp. Yama58-4]
MGRSDTKSIEQLVELVKQKNGEHPVVVYSKTWCPYCMDVKRLLSKLHTKMLVVELDELVEEDELQQALYDLTGQRTVPNVFIGGKHIGGCDATVSLHMQGKLVPLLAEAGAKEE